MRVALVRGPQLSAYELQTYVPLREKGYDLVAFASRAPLVELPTEIPVRQLASPMDTLRRLRGPARKVAEAVAYRRGIANRLDGLEDALHDFDILHAMETFNAFTAQTLDAAKRHRKPLAVTVWENIPYLPVEASFARHRERVLREADAFIAVTQRAKAALLIEGAPEERIHVVPVGIDLDRFRPAPPDPAVRERHGIPADAPLLLFVARLTWEKGLLDILHAMKLLDAQKRTPATAPHLLVVGAGEQRAEADARARAMGIADRIHFAGHVPYAQVAALYHAADVLVLGSIPMPRWQEQYGMVLVEAMASGLPVVVAASGSIPEVVDDAAILVQPNDAMSFADAIAAMLEPEVRRTHAQRGLALARERYDRERVADSIARIYRRLADRA